MFYADDMNAIRQLAESSRESSLKESMEVVKEKKKKKTKAQIRKEEEYFLAAAVSEAAYYIINDQDNFKVTIGDITIMRGR